MKGMVLFYNRERGWGFIAHEGENDLYFHVSGLANRKRLIEARDHVEFDLGERNGRPIAINVSVIYPAPASTEGQRE
jgi:cold shock CspA family protein